ncbi:MAG: hypothetical protein V4621_06655 [Pseudomonadota bacterium]
MSVVFTLFRLSVAGLLLAGLIPAHAVAKGTTSLDAQTGWQLSSNKSPLPYCTLTQKYMDNVVMNFARNAKGERALAVDFQGKRLMKGQETPVQIVAGSVKKSFKITPKSESVLRLQMGQDATFENALATAKTLELRIGDELFKIHTAEFAKDLPKLETCLTALNAPTTPVPAAPPAAALAPAVKIAQVVKAPSAPAPVVPQNVPKNVGQIVENPLPPLLKQPPAQPKVLAQTPPVLTKVQRIEKGVVDLTANMQPARREDKPVDVIVPIASDTKPVVTAAPDRQYDEAQKEIRRLGLALKQQQEDHAREKRALEEMIVDPSVNATVDNVRLKQMEQQITRLEQRMTAEDAPVRSGGNVISDFFSGDGNSVWSGGKPATTPAGRRAAVMPRNAPPPAPVAMAMDEDVFFEAAAPPPAAVKAAPLPVIRAEPPVKAPVALVKPIARPIPLPSAPTLHYWQANDIATLLRRADIALAGQVTAVNARQDGTKLFRWTAENHKGMTEQFPLTSKGDFQSKVDATLARFKSGCVGQFAADRAEAPEFAAGGQTQAHDVACINGQGKGAASSLLFHAKDGVMTVVVLEGTPMAMADAMDERDALVTALMQ